MIPRPSPVPYFRDFGLIVAAVAALLILPWMGMNAGLTVGPALAGLDSEGAFVFITVHHLVQGHRARAHRSAGGSGWVVAGVRIRVG
jgi:hypothetical protein